MIHRCDVDRNSRIVCVSTFIVVGAVCIFAGFNQVARAQITGDEVLHSLERTIDWYHQVTSLNQVPESSQEVTLQNTLRHNARQALRLSFEFARAEAATLGAQEAGGSPTTVPATGTAAASDRGQRLAQSAAKAAQRIAQLQAELSQLTLEIQKAPSDALPLLMARKSELNSELNLAKARQDVLQNLTVFAAHQESGNGGLLGKIADLEQSVRQVITELPSTDPSGSKDPTKTENAVEPKGFHSESVGIIGLVSQLFSLSHEMSELKNLANLTDRLRQSNEKLRGPIRTELLDAIRRGDLLSSERAAGDPKTLSAQSQELDALTTRFRQLAASGVPLGEQMAVLEASRATMLDWHDVLGRAYSRTLRSLLFRLSVMGIGIAVVLILSSLWQRATFHYVKEVRKRRQFLLIRRIVVSCVLAIVFAAGFITEIASLATFAGIMTAGIAVALQTLILSGVAYFFFIGRYGVRAGDRVTVGGVTGDVVETGLFRLYLMELGGTNHLEPTGRVVVFSNSVLFQPAGFFKQLPGAEYIWQEITLSLVPQGDYSQMEKKLLDAVNSVFEKYRDQIDSPHAAVGDVIRAHLPLPRPQTRLRAAGGGLEFLVRYPVPIQRTAEIEDQVTKALAEAIEHQPGIRLTSSGK